MIDNIARTGNITSSEISSLCSNGKAAGIFGKPFYTYVEECNMERRLNRSLTDEVNARPLIWGSLLEQRVHTLLGTEYQYCSNVTLMHPTIDFWAGSPDFIKHSTPQAVCDSKCPVSLKSFCQLVDAGTIERVRTEHKDGEKFFYQLVSNAIITGSDEAELIVYMPYKSELDEIRILAQNVPTDQLHKHYWIAMALDEELPHLNDGGFYKNLNVIKFEVSQSDKDFLTSRVLAAGGLLQPR